MMGCASGGAETSGGVAVEQLYGVVTYDPGDGEGVADGTWTVTAGPLPAEDAQRLAGEMERRAGRAYLPIRVYVAKWSVDGRGA